MAEYEPYMVIAINDQSYTLTGRIEQDDQGGHYVVASYHKPFEEAYSLPPINEIIGKVDNLLKLEGNLSNAWKGVNDEIGRIVILGDVVRAVSSAPIRITDIGINTRTNEYSFGFALDFTTEKTDDITLAGIKLQAFGIVVKASK
jgi:hypothetical protein